MGLLLPHSHRWRQLSITTMNEHIFSFFQRLQVPFLKAFTVSHYSNQRHAALPSSIFDNNLPRLDFLCLRNVNIDNLEFPLHTVKTLEIRGHGTWPSFARLNEMFGGLITLRHLILHVKPAEVLQQVRASSDATGTLSIGQILLPEVALIEVYTSEWLTADIAELLQLFACPKLQRLTMRESVSSTTEKVNMIMDFAVLKQGVKCSPVPKLMADPSDEEDRSTAWDDVEPCRKLWLQSANIYHACRVMSVSSASIITTLELHKVFFPRLSLMKEMFATLKSLVNLLILDFDSNSAMASITGLGPSQLDNIEWVSTQGTVIVPNLQRLLIDFNSSVSCFSSLEEPMEGDNNDRTKDFLQLFHLPSLSSLTLKDASLDQMRGVAEVFSQHHLEREDAYPKLAALKIVNMTEPLPLDPIEPGYVNLVQPFPRLEKLSLQGVHSNALVRCLVQHPLHPSPISSLSPAWPRLHTISISDDPNASKPLLHRAITVREEAGFRLVSLHLDAHFNRNLDSWEWMKEKVGKLELLESTSRWYPSGETDNYPLVVGGWR